MYHVSRVDNLSWHFAISHYEDFLWLAVTRLIIFKFQSLANRPLTNSNISSFEASWNFESSVRIQESLQTCRELNSASVRFLFFRKLKLWLFLAPQGCPIQLTHDVSFFFPWLLWERLLFLSAAASKESTLQVDTTNFLTGWDVCRESLLSEFGFPGNKPKPQKHSKQICNNAKPETSLAIQCHCRNWVRPLAEDIRIWRIEKSKLSDP